MVDSTEGAPLNVRLIPNADIDDMVEPEDSETQNCVVGFVY